jgi:hypothetical protein
LATANIKISGTNYFQNPPTTNFEFYSMLRDQFPNKRALIDYNEWSTTRRYYCFDVSRYKDVSPNPNQSLPIMFTATQSDALARDYIFIIERLQTVILKMASGSTTVTVQ